MRKIAKCLLAISLASIFVFTSACSNGSGSTGSTNKTGAFEYKTYTTEDGIHKVSATELDDRIIENGVSTYKIVVPKDTSRLVGNAARELQNMLKLSTGVTLDIITDEGIVYYPNKSTYISIGETNLLDFADVEIDKELLQDSGFRVVTKDKSVFLCGGGDHGTYYSVSEFLKHTINYGIYANDEKIYDKKINVNLYDFDVTEVPDFAFRMPYFRTLFKNETYSLDLRVNHESDSVISVDGRRWHNTFAFLPKSTHGESHPDWYSIQGDQLCYLARGNEQEFNAMFDTFMEKFIDVVVSNPGIENITITQEDYASWCTCPACTEEIEKYGGAGSITALKFCNKVSDAFEEYKKENNYDRNINIWFFAYLLVEDAPVKKDANGNYQPIAEDAICRDNVFPFYAPLYAKYTQSFYHEDNAASKDKMDQWKAVSKKICMWTYSVCFSDFLAPYNWINAMKESYVFLKNYNVHFLFEQSQHLNDPAPDFANLKIWLSSKLMWNVNLDINQLIDEYCDNYYKEAAPAMKELIYYYNANFNVIENSGGQGGVFSTNLSAEFYPRGTVNKFNELINQAFESILPIKDVDLDMYETLYDRISLDSLSFRYIDIKLYGDTYGEKELLEKKMKFKEDATRVGILKTSEKYQNEGFIDELWVSWGV